MIISQEQLNRLKDLLTDEEFANILNAVKENSIDKFQDLLNDYIVMRFENDEPTEEADKLESIYFEIYNQN